MVGGVRQNVLTRENGDPILPNSKPSRRDVQTLKRMYGVRTGFFGKMLGERSNPLKNMFDRIRKKDPGSGCL